MKGILAALGVLAVCSANAQFSTLNSMYMVPNFWHDVHTDTLTSGSSWPTCFFDDANVSDPTGGWANRHRWSVSNDGGVTPYLVQTDDYWTFTIDVKLQDNGTKWQEAGMYLLNPGNYDHVFMVNHSGEVACFAGAFPFYSFTVQYGDVYTLGTTARLAVTYFKDQSDGNYKIIYRYNNHFSPAKLLSNNEGYLLPDTELGGYLNAQNDTTFPNNWARGDFKVVGVSTADTVVPENMTVNLGKITAGDIYSLHYTDGKALRVCRFIVPNQTVSPVTVEVQGVSAYPSLSALTMHVNSKMFNAGSFQQTLDLFDYSTNTYSDTRTDAITLAYAARDLVATGNIGRYLGPNHEVKGRFRVKQSGPTSVLQWCADFDEVTFRVAP